MKVFIVGLFAALFFFIASDIRGSLADEIPAAVRQAADEGVNIFLKNPQMSGKQKMGFRSQAELDKAFAGEGFRIYTIPPGSLLESSASRDIMTLAMPTNLWQFMIRSGGQAKVLLMVDIVKGAWTPVSIGSAGLAKELSLILDKWPASQGYQYRLIRVYQAKADFVELSQAGRVIGIVPTSSLNAVTGQKNRTFNPAEILDSGAVQDALRPVVQANIGGFR